MGQKIGSGSQANAYIVTRVEDGTKFIAKVNADNKDMALAEAERLKIYNSKNIVKYVDSFTEKTKFEEGFVIIMEYCDGKQPYLFIIDRR